MKHHGRYYPQNNSSEKSLRDLLFLILTLLLNTLTVHEALQKLYLHIHTAIERKGGRERRKGDRKGGKTESATNPTKNLTCNWAVVVHAF